MNERGNAYLRAFCLSGSLNFTKFFFREKTGRDFVVNSHHRMICGILDDVFRGKLTKVIINIAPRYSKTELAVKNFISMGLALNPAAKFIHLSYSDDLAHDNSEEIRDTVKSGIYRSLFPYVSIKKDSDSKKKWSTTSGGGVYATATGGQVTGFGAGSVDDVELDNELCSMECPKFSGAIVIDDPIKPEDALSDVKRERVNQRFETTIRNRVNSRHTPIIIIMQRLHENDLCGYLMKIEPGEWTVLSIPCIMPGKDGQDAALWPFKHTIEELYAIRNANPFVFETQYMQNPTPMEGLMYASFRTYREIPVTVRAARKNYTDTADRGSDWLCSIDYVETETGNYITDVLYTQEPMEVTETSAARMMAADGVEVANIEGNNGGEGFARNVERNLRIMGAVSTAVKTFHQSANKEVRIFSRSAEVQNMCFFPEGWEARWPAFHAALKSYRKAGKNAHDDAPDALTGTVEMRDEYSFSVYPAGNVPDGPSLAEIHPGLDGKLFALKAVCSGGKAYVVWAHCGEDIPMAQLKGMCGDADVHIEVPPDMEWYVREFRKECGRCFGRTRKAGMPSVIESFRIPVKETLLFPDDGGCSAFVNSMLLYDGRHDAGAMYAASCLVNRKLSRNL